MSSKKLNTNKVLSWNSDILALSSSSKPSQSLIKLQNDGFNKVKDLLWILPLRLQSSPTAQKFNMMNEGELFLGKAKLISANFSPSYGRRGKGRVQLFNATLMVKDQLSDEIINLKFFNTYPGFQKQIEAKDSFTFLGQPTLYKGQLQINNPKLDPPETKSSTGMLIEYPTVATVPGRYIKGIIDKIPDTLWEQDVDFFETRLNLPTNFQTLIETFAIMHGKRRSNAQERIDAHADLVYYEFFEDQLKVLARKQGNKAKAAPKINWDENHFKDFLALLPYELTKDQQAVLNQIKEDFAQGHPMMRMAQGDVGCGKTTVALLAALMVVKNKGQVALMCPTESLALQHAQTFRELVPHGTEIELLLGSTRPAQKKTIYSRLKTGKIDIIIGTHSLIQDSVDFKNLQFVIIDEQHKFGVEQRQRLSGKGYGAHTLIMTATPIPRTLQLAQYGDLEISTIRTMPTGRSGIKTRIVSASTYEKYLSFIKTRLSLGEQVYIVAPAITESETLDIRNVEEIEKEYKQYFPEFRIQALHGKLKASDKQEIFEKFSDNSIDLLISTSVIEVGINVTNATVMSIYNPDRFGLSSLHQLRGRVGRGSKPGFCFLVANQKVSKDSMDRLKVIEQSIDGFHIAEADLKNRGEGDLFGISQSGSVTQRKVASIFEHFDIFDRVNRDLVKITREQAELVEVILKQLNEDQKVSSTI
ncbi:MAG: ATP-dependent DNA helicase RecG [Bacteriovoracaceae bacterium]|nr:ATP-dependent DNA helicase RecG [Bacteriovoracaceae bacterium]